jgi:cyanophycinase
MTTSNPSGTGPIAIVGSGEFTRHMEAVDRHLLEGRIPRAAFLPTAAGEEGAASVNRWLRMGTDHYRRLGVEPVPVPVLNSHDANDAELAALINNVGLVYLSGGNPGYVSDSLRDSLVWKAIVEQWRNGAAVAGCSAGAGALTTLAPNVRSGARQTKGLSLVANLAVIPHYDKMRSWDSTFESGLLAQSPVGVHVIGVDEDTALVGGLTEWTVMGRQSVHILSGERRSYAHGQTVTLS